VIFTTGSGSHHGQPMVVTVRTIFILKIGLLEWYGLWECVWVDIHHSSLVEKNLSSNLQLSNVVLNVGVGFVLWIIQTPKLVI